MAVHHGSGRSAAWWDLFVHDGGEFGEHVPVVGPHLLLVLQLVLLDQPLIHVQGLAARFRKLPAGGRKKQKQRDETLVKNTRLNLEETTALVVRKEDKLLITDRALTCAYKTWKIVSRWKITKIAKKKKTTKFCSFSPTLWINIKALSQ